jgi:hypothetical protein
MSTLSRFPLSTGANPFFKRDNTQRILTVDYQNPPFTQTALVITAAETLIQPAVLTGIITYTVNVGTGLADEIGPFVGDVIKFLFTPDTSTRVVTFGTGFLPTGTLSVTTGKTATASFTFDGTVWRQTGSAVTA